MIARYLIISLGSIGRRHLANVRRLQPEARLGVLRLHASPPADLPSDADEQFFSLQEALAFEPHAAIIAGPATTHLEIASALINAGIPVFIEKPLSHTTEGWTELIESAHLRDLPLMVGYNLRFLPSLREARRLILKGAIGEVLAARAEVGQYLPDWRPGSRYQENVSARSELGGGALLELSHEVDYLTWIFGLPDTVTARGGRYSDLEIDVEDMAELLLDYESPRRLVNIHLDFLQRAPSRSCRFIGNHGTLIWNGIADTLDLYTADGSGWQRIDTTTLPDRNAMYLDEISHFLDCGASGTPPMIDAKQSYDVLSVIETAKVSIAEGRTLKIHGYAKP